MKKILRAENISCIFSSKNNSLNLFENIDFSIEPGDVVSIKGKSGSGKSTLLHILSSLREPSSGNVYIFDKDIYKLSTSQISLLRNRNIGFVFQSFNLINELTPLENVILPIAICSYKDKKRLKRRILGLAEELEISYAFSRRTRDLSGGEKARIAILRALCLEPDLVFLDEPTGALDTESAKSIERLILNLSKKSEGSFVYVTHDNEFAKMAKRKYEIRDRKLVEYT